MDLIKIAFILQIMSFVSVVQAQVKGKVLDATNQQAIEGVHILNKGELIAVTAAGGRFKIDSVSSGAMVFQHVSYISDTVMWHPHVNKLTITLNPALHQISGPAIRGYGYYDTNYRQISNISSIREASLNEKAVINPAAMLNSVPGLVFHRGARNTQRLSIRGAGAQSMYSTTRLKTYFNGVPLSSAMGEVFLDDLLWNQATSVAVIKGPVPPVYGSTTGGVILMRDNLDSRTGTTFTSGFTAGSFDYRHHHHKLRVNAGKLSVSLQYQDINEDGFRENDDYQGNSLRMLLQYDLAAGHTLHYFLGYSAMKAFIPSSLSEQDYRNNPEAAAQNWQDAAGYEKNRQVIQGLTVKSRYGAVFSQETTLYGVSRKGDERRPFNILGDKHTAGGMRTILTAEDVLNGKSDLSLQAGGSYRYGRYFWNTSETLPEGESGALLTDQKQNRHQGALFLFAAYRIGDITAEAGLNVSAIGYTTSSNMDSNNEDYERYNPGAVALPYFFARYQLTPHTDLYATTGRGHASPVYEEAIDSEGNIDTGLLPEYSWKREAGMKTETAHFTFQGALYHNSVSNQLITKRLAEDRYIKENAGETDFSGVEAVMGVRLFSNKVLSINADINYSYSQYKFKEFVDENNDYSGNKVPGIPAHQGGVVLSIHMWNKLQLHYRWSGMSKMPMNDANNKYYGGHQLMNLHLTYREQILKKLHLTTFARAGNIGGVHYASMILVNARGFGGAEPRYYYPGAPTNFQAGVRLNYNF